MCPSGATGRTCARPCVQVVGEPVTMNLRKPASLECCWHSEQGLQGLKLGLGRNSFLEEVSVGAKDS